MANAIPIDLSQLILGRKLSCPVFDQRGTLLLGAGCAITAEMKAKLVARNITKILVNECDLATATLTRSDHVLAKFDSKLNDRIDQLINTGAFNVANSGPAVRGEVVDHGCKKLDSHHQQAVQKQFQEHAVAVDTLLAKVGTRQEINGAAMKTIATSCVKMLATDFASTLSSVISANQDSTLAEHSLNVATLAAAVAIEMGFDAGNVGTIYTSALLADIGMTRVPEHIRNATRRLTSVEFVEIEKHAIHAANDIARITNLPDMVQVVAYQVHERPDGSGYPRGRERKQIHPFARVISVADAYIGMTTARPHRLAVMPYAAIECLLKQAQQCKIDADAFRALLRVLSLYPIGSVVVLSDGRVAQVVRSNGPKYDRPIVLLLQDANGNPVPEDDENALVDLSQSELSVIQAIPTPGASEIGLTQDVMKPASSSRTISFSKLAAMLSDSEDADAAEPEEEQQLQANAAP